MKLQSCMFFAIFHWSCISANNIKEDMDYKSVMIKYNILDSLFGAFDGDIDIKLLDILALNVGGGYFNQEHGLINPFGHNYSRDQNYFVSIGAKWIFNGIFWKKGFYTTPRLIFDHKISSSQKRENIFLPGVNLGFFWISPVGFLVDGFIGINLFGIGSKDGLLPFPTFSLGVGWAF